MSASAEGELGSGAPDTSHPLTREAGALTIQLPSGLSVLEESVVKGLQSSKAHTSAVSMATRATETALFLSVKARTGVLLAIAREEGFLDYITRERDELCGQKQFVKAVEKKDQVAAKDLSHRMTLYLARLLVFITSAGKAHQDLPRAETSLSSASSPPTLASSPFSWQDDSSRSLGEPSFVEEPLRRSADVASSKSKKPHKKQPKTKAGRLTTTPLKNADEKKKGGRKVAPGAPQEADPGVQDALLSVLISELKGTLRSLNTKVQEVEGNLVAQQAVARAQRKELDLVRFRISEQELAISSLQASEQALNRRLQNVPEPYDDAREIQEVLTRTDLLEKEQQIFHHQTDQIMLLLGKVYTSTEPDALARLLESYNLQLILDKCREIY